MNYLQQKNLIKNLGIIFGHNEKKNLKNLLLHILKTNEKIYKQQQRLVNRYQVLSEKQEKQEKLNKATRYLALGFILVRIFVFCFNYFS